MQKVKLQHVLNFIFLSIPIALIGLIPKVLGVFIIPIALLFRKPTHFKGVEEQYLGWKPMRLPKIFFMWDNVTTGTMGNFGWTKKSYNPWFYKTPTSFWSQWYWLALRNPCNGLYGTKLFQCIQADCEVSHIGKDLVDNYKYGWQFIVAKGASRTYTGLYIYFPYTKSPKSRCLELRVGYKLLPTEPNRTIPIGITMIINPFKGR